MRKCCLQAVAKESNALSVPMALSAEVHCLHMGTILEISKSSWSTPQFILMMSPLEGDTLVLVLNIYVASKDLHNYQHRSRSEIPTPFETSQEVHTNTMTNFKDLLTSSS
ncbi:hypothetical protein ACJMK2_010357 [Sinanodonta woodiana]|uniref:Uncharacterized protein n=1 Tax=Sinanodonta woodiana TaxID=1069815 RepID=A0ABD3VGC6_SINWO